MRLERRHFPGGPPLHGLAAVVERGHLLRRRRRQVVAGVTTGLLTLSVALTLTSAGNPRVSLQQTPASPGATSTPSPLSTPPGTAPQPNGLSAPQPGAPASTGKDVVSAPEPTTTAALAVTPTWHKEVTRQVTTTQYTGSCSQAGLATSDAARNGWCVSPYRSGDVAGSLVTFVGIQVCREFPQVSDTALAFATAQELEVTIYRGAEAVWTWSDSVTLAPVAHDLGVAPQHCLRWRTTWNGTSSDGQLLSHGTYAVVATVLATNQSGLTARTTARIRA